MTNKLTKDTNKFMVRVAIIKRWFEAEDVEVSDQVLGRMASRLGRELERQKKEIREELDKILPVKIMWEYNERIDQAIKTINDK